MLLLHDPAAVKAFKEGQLEKYIGVEEVIFRGQPEEDIPENMLRLPNLKTVHMEYELPTKGCNVENFMTLLKRNPDLNIGFWHPGNQFTHLLAKYMRTGQGHSYMSAYSSLVPEYALACENIKAKAAKWHECTEAVLRAQLPLPIYDEIIAQLSEDHM